MTEKVIMAVVVLSTYLLMLAAFFRPQHRKFHVSTMIFIMLFDMGIPVYLYFYRDWYTRLFVHGDIESFLVWMHVILVLSLYILYVFQVQIGRKLLRGDAEASLRIEHRGQGKGILVTRALAILTGALLIEPDPAARG